MFWVNIVLEITDGKTLTTRYPQSFPTREAAEQFQRTNSAKFKETVVFEEVAPQAAPVGFNDEDLPNATKDNSTFLPENEEGRSGPVSS